MKYVEKRLGCSRTFELTPNNVELTVKGFAGDAKYRFTLSEINPNPDTARSVEHTTMALCALPGLLLLLCIIAFYYNFANLSDFSFFALMGVSVGIMVAGIFLAPKTKFFMFKSKSEFPAFDIRQRRKNHERTEEFLEALSRNLKSMESGSRD